MPEWKSNPDISSGKRPRVLLVAGNDSVYLPSHLPRLLRSASSSVSLLAPAVDILHHSRFVDEYIRAPGSRDAFVGFVESYLMDHRYDLVVFAIDDVLESIVGHPPRAPWLAWLRPDVADAITSRTGFAAWAEERSIPMPPGSVCHSTDDAMRWVEEHGASMMKTNHTAGGAGVRLVTSPADVVARWRELGCPQPFLMQKFIAGRAGVTELVLRRGEILAWFSSIKERTGTPFGGSIMRRFWTPSGMEDLVDCVARNTAFHGLCGFDWIEDGTTGRPFLNEFHPRATSGFICGKYAGVDVVGAIADLLNSHPARTRGPDSPERLELAPVCCYFPDHLAYAITKRRRDLQYWLPGADAVAWGLVPFDDPFFLGHELIQVAVGAARWRLVRLARRVKAGAGSMFHRLLNVAKNFHVPHAHGH
jgi:hypothetical protein